MLARHAQPKVLGQDAQAVARPARQQDRRQLPGVQPGVLAQQALAAQEAQVEADVVADHRRAADEARDLVGNLVEARLAGHVAVGDAGELRDLVWDRPAGIDERAVPVDDPVILELGRADLDDGVVGVIQAGGFQVKCDEGAGHGSSVSRLSLLRSSDVHSFARG